MPGYKTLVDIHACMSTNNLSTVVPGLLTTFQRSQDGIQINRFDMILTMPLETKCSINVFKQGTLVSRPS